MKVKYDKKLNKFHITFDKKNVEKEKKEIYKKLNTKYGLIFTFDTEIDGRSEELRKLDIELLIEDLNSCGLEYELSNREVHTSKKIFGIPTMKQVKNIHSTLKTTIPKSALSDDLIDFFIEHEVKINFTDEESQEHEFYDSAIFMKIFSSYDLSRL